MIKATLSALAALCCLTGCVIVQDAYDNAAVDECDQITDPRQRLDCIDAAERAASARDADKRD